MSVDELMPRARQAWAGGARSKNALRKTLRVAWDRADEVFSRLSAEEQQEQTRKHRARRTALTQLRSRKRPGRTLPARRGVLPEAPISPAVTASRTASVPVPNPTAVEPVAASRTGGVPRWPLLLLALPAFVAIWSGWVGLGGLTGFGVVHPLPGIRDSWSLNTAITLPIGLETYGTYALHVWLSGAVPPRARRFAMWSAIGSLTLGAAGQVAYHLMVAAGMTAAPWQITTVVACIPVAVLGMGAALYHLVHVNKKEN
jgi:hypothetical protein